MKFGEYLEEYGAPDKAIVFDVTYHHQTIHPDHYYLPVVQGLAIDRLEQSFSSNQVVLFLRCPQGVVV